MSANAREPAASAEAAGAHPAGASISYVRYVIALLCVVNVFNYMDRMALAVLLPHIKEDLVLSDGQLGLLVGLAFAVFYAICGIPISRWADRGIRRNIIALALATWSVMTALSGTAQNFWHLFVARIGVGAGEAGCVPPAQSVLCDYVPRERRSGVLAFHNFGLFVGTMVGMAVAGSLGELIGWRWTFVVLGVPGIALAFIVWMTLREPRRGRFDAGTEARGEVSFIRTLAVLWRLRTYRFLMMFTVMNGFIQYGLNQWWPSFYSRSFDLSLSSIGISLGIAIGAGSGIGVLLGGLLGDRAARGGMQSALKVGAAGTALAIPAALGSVFVPSAWGSITLVALAGLCWSVTTGPFLATLYTVTPPQMRATAGAIMIFFLSVLGFGLGPLSVGVLSDLLTSTFGEEALRYALLGPMCLLPLCVAALYAAARTLPAELATADVPAGTVTENA